MPINSRRRPSKPPARPLDLDEIEQDPGFRGMLSFLEVSPEEKLRHLALRDEADRHSPMGEPPMGGILIPAEHLQDGAPGRPGTVSDNLNKSSESAHAAPVVKPAATVFLDRESPIGQLSMGQPPRDESPIGWSPIAQTPMGYSPMGHSDSGRPDLSPVAIPTMDVEGRGKRPLRYCRTVQDGHTSTEELAYQALWAHAQRYGQTDTDGSQVVDLALSQLRTILNTDHKNIKRLLTSLKSKLVLEVVRPPDYRRAISTRYRIFNHSQVLERRRTANMLWVVRTRTVRFVPMEMVSRLVAGEQPMGSPIPQQS